MEVYQNNKDNNIIKEINGNNSKYTVDPFNFFLFPFLMVKVHRVCIIYSNLRELSLLERLLGRLVIAKSLSAILARPKVSFSPLQDLVITKS